MLGFEIVTEVKNGENSGRDLAHNFVVLKHEHREINKDKPGVFSGTVNLPTSDIAAARQAIVAWVNHTDNLKPVQATGGYLQ